MNNEITDIKTVLAYLLRESEWSEAERMMLGQAIKNLGLRLKDEQSFVSDSSRHPRNQPL